MRFQERGESDIGESYICSYAYKPDISRELSDMLVEASRREPLDWEDPDIFPMTSEDGKDMSEFK